MQKAKPVPVLVGTLRILPSVLIPPPCTAAVDATLAQQPSLLRPLREGWQIRLGPSIDSGVRGEPYCIERRGCMHRDLSAPSSFGFFRGFRPCLTVGAGRCLHSPPLQPREAMPPAMFPLADRLLAVREASIRKNSAAQHSAALAALRARFAAERAAIEQQNSKQNERMRSTRARAVQTAPAARTRPFRSRGAAPGRTALGLLCAPVDRFLHTCGISNTVVCDASVDPTRFRRIAPAAPDLQTRSPMRWLTGLVASTSLAACSLLTVHKPPAAPAQPAQDGPHHTQCTSSAAAPIADAVIATGLAVTMGAGAGVGSRSRSMGHEGPPGPPAWLTASTLLVGARARRCCSRGRPCTAPTPSPSAGTRARTQRA